MSHLNGFDEQMVYPIDLNDDLERQFEKTMKVLEDEKPDSDDTVIITVFDGLPITNKIEQFRGLFLNKILNAFLNKQGVKEVTVNDIDIPVVNGSTKGIAFVYTSEVVATLLCEKFDNYQFDKSHIFSVNKWSTIEESEYTEAEESVVTKYCEPNYKNWLRDTDSRNQFHIQSKLGKEGTVKMYCNIESAFSRETPEQIFEKKTWTDIGIVRWSPQGSFMISYHEQGVVLWTNPTKTSWEKYIKFICGKVSQTFFSHDEKYIITLSYSGNTFTLWDIRSGAEMYTFGCTVKKIEWSHDSQYFYVLESYKEKMFLKLYKIQDGVLNKYTMELENIHSLCFSKDDLKHKSMICYIIQNPMKINLMNVEAIIGSYREQIEQNPGVLPQLMINDRTCLKSQVLPDVGFIDVYWSPNGDYFILKTLKAKNKIGVVLSLYHLREKNIPVNVIVPKSEVIVPKTKDKTSKLQVSWDFTKSLYEDIDIVISETVQWKMVNDNKFAVTNRVNGNITIYKIEKSEINILRVINNKPDFRLKWSVHNDFFHLVKYGKSGDDLMEFWHIDGHMINDEQFGIYHYTEWDPSGRFVLSLFSHENDKAKMVYQIHSLMGTLLHQEHVTDVKEITWRPRPKFILPKEKMNSVIKNISKYSQAFNKKDHAKTNKISVETKQYRQSLFRDWEIIMNGLSEIVKENNAFNGNATETEETYIETIVEEVLSEVKIMIN